MNRGQIVFISAMIIGVVGLAAIGVAYAYGVPTQFVYWPFTVLLLILAGVNYHYTRVARRRQ